MNLHDVIMQLANRIGDNDDIMEEVSEIVIEFLSGCSTDDMLGMLKQSNAKPICHKYWNYTDYDDVIEGMTYEVLCEEISNQCSFGSDNNVDIEK